MTKKLKGCLGENLAICHFQKEGYYVFKACQRNGPIDLITVDPRNLNIECYDVKGTSKRYKKQLKQRKKEKNEIQKKYAEDQRNEGQKVSRILY
jgi:Holliday junction resolvase-like predicted endonuclease